MACRMAKARALKADSDLKFFFRHELENGKCISRTDDDRFPHAEHRRAK